MENQSDKPEVTRWQMEDTRSSLTDKLEALESQVADTVHSATEAVTDTVATVKESVMDTVAAVTDRVQETAHSVAQTFDIGHQTEKRPWALLGTAVGVGCLVGWLTGNRAEATAGAGSGAPAQGNGKHHHTKTNGASHKPGSAVRKHAVSPEPATPAEPAFFHEELAQLKGLAFSVLFGVLRDLVARSLPETIGQRVAEEVDRLTRAVGGEPLPAPVLPESWMAKDAWFHHDEAEHDFDIKMSTPSVGAPLSGHSRISRGMVP